MGCTLIPKFIWKFQLLEFDPGTFKFQNGLRVFVKEARDIGQVSPLVPPILLSVDIICSDLNLNLNKVVC